MNEKIMTYCKEFIESTENPQFALFIKGEWGTGKTYFVNKLIEYYEKNECKIRREEIIYVSLFGVTNYSEIDMKIFQAIHPVLSSKGMQLIGTVFRTALRLGSNIDINGDGKQDASITIGGLATGKNNISLSKSIKKLIIIDDIERSLLDPAEIFGYFSDIVVQSDSKLIFIGNENQILDNDEHKKTQFLKIKEKTIGLEFKIEPDIESAVNNFLIEIPISADQNEEIKKLILEVVNMLKCNNLRTIRQSIYNLRILIGSIDDKIDDKDKIDIIRIFVALYIQKWLGLITSKNEIDEAIVVFLKYRLGYREYLDKNKNEQKSIFFKYYGEYIPLSNCWSNIIFEGNYDKDFLTSEYEKEMLINSEEEPKNLFKLLKNWKSLEKDAFKALVNTVGIEMDNGLYLHPGEILHYLNTIALFSEWKLVPTSIRELTSRVKKTIKKYSETIEPVDDWSRLTDSYGGYCFSDSIKEVLLIKNMLIEITKRNCEVKIASNIENDIQSITSNVKQFCSCILHQNGNGKYYRKPFLKLANIDHLFEVMISLPVGDQDMIIYSLEERYGKRYSEGKVDPEYYDDLKNLKRLAEKYKDSIGDIEFNPTGLLIKRIADSLEKLVEFFQNSIKT